MIADIASILKAQIEDLPFVDKITGLVVTAQTKKEDKVEKFPIAVNDNLEDCLKTGRYLDYTPDSNKKSVIYFEGNGPLVKVPDKVTNTNFRYQAPLILVAWLNTLKLEINYHAASVLATQHLLAAFNPNTFNSGNYHRLNIMSGNILESDSKLFSKYTYNLYKTQYLTFPYVAIGIELLVEFSINPNCIPSFDDSQYIRTDSTCSSY